MSAGRVIYGAPAYNPPRLVGPLPGRGYVPLDPFTATVDPHRRGTTSGTIVNNAVEGVLLAVPYAILLVGYSISSNVTDAGLFGDFALAHAPNADAGPRDVDLIADTLATRTFSTADDPNSWPSMTPCPAPVPVAPGWYWLLWKVWRVTGTATLSVHRSRGMAQGERCAGSGGIPITTRLAPYLAGLGGAAMPLRAGGGVILPLYSLAVA